MKIKKQKSIYIAWLAIFILFIFSIASYKMIPFGDPDGLDFHNLYAYSTCDEELKDKYDNNIYLAGGQDCHDAMGREFVYPPLLFHSVKWVGEFKTFEKARFAWRTFIILGTLVSLLIWLGSISTFFKLLPFTGLLFFQFPMLFALERGNNDVLILLSWTLTYLLFSKEKYFWSGVLASICVLMKVYPLFAFLVIFGGLTLSCLREHFYLGEKKTLNALKLFSMGSLISGLIIIISFNDLWYSWYLRVSHFSDFEMVVSYLNHSVQYFFKAKVFGQIIFLAMMGVWTLHFIYSKKERRVLSFAGALAITTYYSAVSYDYNQIVIYPLILLTISSLLKNFEWRRYFVLFGVLMGVIAHRGLFEWGGDFGFKFHMFIQVFFISMLAVIDLPLWKLKHFLKFNKMRRKLI